MKKILPFFFLAMLCTTTYAQICNSGSLIVCPGRILGQEEAGTVGGFGAVDEWMTIGKAPFPVPGTGDFPHGERYQRTGSTMLQQMEFRNNAPVDVVDGVIAIGAVKTNTFTPAALPRLDFEYVYQNQTTFPPSDHRSRPSTASIFTTRDGMRIETTRSPSTGSSSIALTCAGSRTPVSCAAPASRSSTGRRSGGRSSRPAAKRACVPGRVRCSNT